MRTMNKKIDKRYRIIVGIVIFLMTVLCARLFVLTMAQHEQWAKKAVSLHTKVIYTPAPRGNIYDRNGRVLATNKQMFAAVFNASSLDSEEINGAAESLVNMLEKNGDKVIDDFPIKTDSNGKFYYTYIADRNNWLEKNGFSKDATPIDVLESKKNEYEIAKDISRYDALDVLFTKYRVSLPIVPKNMEFTYERDLRHFLEKTGFSERDIEEGISAEECFKKLRELYKIPKKMSDADARKIFIVRNGVSDNRFQKYVPVIVAKNISEKSVIEIEELSMKGCGVMSCSERYYPEKETACHIIGYMGAISESEAQKYVDEKHYLSTDLIGKDGIEAAFEDKLHGKPGIKKIKVNSHGDYVSTISETPPEKGSDVYLTIDLDMQKSVQATLKKEVENSKTGRSGAAVALDPETSDVIAMASYPEFDPNMFAQGIKEKDWESVQPENPRDNLSPAPLYNNATMASTPPGSTFKLVTALAGLESGMPPEKIINTKGVIKLGERNFGCFIWNKYRHTHGPVNFAKAIGTSCNYYFYCLSTNKDWSTGKSLGETGMSIDRLMDTAKRFGIGKKTGIEIGENVAAVPTEKQKTLNAKIGAWNAIYSRSYEFFPKKVYENEKELRNNLDIICDYIDENPSYGELCSLIEKNTDVIDKYADEVASIVKFDYFNQAKWTDADAFNVAIGQGGNSTTPVQMANLVATIANNGKRNQVSLVKGIEGYGRKKKKEPVDMGMSERNREAILKGMEYACNKPQGTLTGCFRDYPVTVAGKSGTAEYQSVKQPKNEVEYIKKNLSKFNKEAGTSVKWEQVEEKMRNLMINYPEKYSTRNDAVDMALIEASEKRISTVLINKYKGTYEPFSWTVTFAPSDKPEIAVSTVLFEGGSGGGNGIIKGIMDYYFNVHEKKDEEKAAEKKSNEEKRRVRNEKNYKATRMDGTNHMRF